jgi:hypothetical protein
MVFQLVNSDITSGLAFFYSPEEVELLKKINEENQFLIKNRSHLRKDLDDEQNNCLLRIRT